MSRRREVVRNVAFSLGAVLLVLVGGFLALFAFALFTSRIPFGSAFLWANIGVVVSLVIVAITLVAAIEVTARRWGKRVVRIWSIPAIAVLLAVGIALTQKEPPVVQPFTEFFLPRGPHDVLLLVDPNDPAVRELAAQARSNPEGLAPELSPKWGTDVSFGLAVLRPPGTGEPWSLVQPPNPDYRKVVAALASLKPSAARSATGSLARALRQVATPYGASRPWQRSVQQTIVLIGSDVPTKQELLTANGTTEKEWEKTLRSVSRSAAPDFDRSAFSVIWSKIEQPAASTQRAWQSWTRTARGNAASHKFKRILDSAVYASLNRHFTEDYALAVKFRPHLKFHKGEDDDDAEKFRPLDINGLLAKTQPEPCEPVQFRRDECPPERIERKLQGLYKQVGVTYEPKAKGHSMERLYLANEKSYVELGGDERMGQDLPPDDAKTIGKIYYRITRDAGRASIEYWWFFRYNESPVFSNVMCLAGLSIASGSCFDHQGDWEGITVAVVDRADPGTNGAYVTYTGHNWPGYSYRWGRLQAGGHIADGTHPIVYVAKGSHASYPTPCESDCTQLDFTVGPFDFKVPDGAHDGRLDWPPNAITGDDWCGCLEPLPLDFYGRPSGWLQYQGQWGSAACTYILKACTRVSGPHSPAYQGRFGKPFKFEWGDLETAGLPKPLAATR